MEDEEENHSLMQYLYDLKRISRRKLTDEKAEEDEVVDDSFEVKLKG